MALEASQAILADVEVVDEGGTEVNLRDKTGCRLDLVVRASRDAWRARSFSIRTPLSMAACSATRLPLTVLCEAIAFFTPLCEAALCPRVRFREAGNAIAPEVGSETTRIAPEISSVARAARRSRRMFLCFGIPAVSAVLDMDQYPSGGYLNPPNGHSADRERSPWRGATRARSSTRDSSGMSLVCGRRSGRCRRARVPGPVEHRDRCPNRGVDGSELPARAAA